MPVDLLRMQSYELAPLQQIDYQMNDAIRFEHTDRLRKIEDRKQRKLKKRKRRRRQQQQDDG
jgi:hypothetical protein